MANNRLYIKCNRCGELLFVGKHYGGAWGVNCYDGIAFDKKLSEFLFDHYLDCRNNASDYSFIAENDDDFPDHPKYFSYGG